MKSNRLAGHVIKNEGRLGNANTPWSQRHAMGAIQCSCGDWSPQLPSTNARREWHREHKDDVRSGRVRAITARPAAETSDAITLADIERQIALHRQAIKDLCEVGIRLDETKQMPGFSAMKWLLGQGYRSDIDARKLIAQVVQERRADREGQATTVTGSPPSFQDKLDRDHAALGGQDGDSAPYAPGVTE